MNWNQICFDVWDKIWQDIACANSCVLCIKVQRERNRHGSRTDPKRISRLLGMGLDEFYNNMSDTRSIINVFLVLFQNHILRLATLLRITPSGDRLQLTFYTYVYWWHMQNNVTRNIFQINLLVNIAIHNIWHYIDHISMVVPYSIHLHVRFILEFLYNYLKYVKSINIA